MDNTDTESEGGDGTIGVENIDTSDERLVTNSTVIRMNNDTGQVISSKASATGTIFAPITDIMDKVIN